MERGHVLAGTSVSAEIFVWDCGMSTYTFGGLKVLLISGNERRRCYWKTEA
jgi:hypothetical protein